jgi:O-methyltransferase involved in polyketide biosynthesis
MQQEPHVKIQLQGVEETMLLPLWARARETGRRSPIIRDEKALEIIDRIDYDFGVFTNSWKNEAVMQTAIAIRTEILDRAVKGFIADHPDGVVVNVGAGLDTRFYRLDNGRVRWFDVDLPRSIALRRQFLPESDRHRFIERSFLDPEWVADIDAAGAPVLVIAEGLFMYFEEADVRGFLANLGDRLPGAQVLFEAVDPTLMAIMNLQGWVQQLGAPFKWGLADARELERWGHGIRLLDQWHQLDYHTPRWGQLGFFKFVPPLRAWMKIVHIHVGTTP